MVQTLDVRIAEPQDWNAIAAIRTAVFITEQSCPPEEEWDGLDDASWQFIGTVDGTPAATARWRGVDTDEGPTAKLERFAVLKEHRGLGWGRMIVGYVVEHATATGYRRLMMHAQSHLVELYRAFGFEVTGEEFMEAGIPHRTMVRQEPMTDFREALRPILGPERWVVAIDAAVAGAQQARDLQSLGASEVMLLAGSRGTGEVPPPEEMPQFDLGISADSLMGGIRGYNRALESLPEQAIAALDGFDPERTARVFPALFNTATTIAGRSVFGARPPKWVELEDKLVVPELCSAAGIPFPRHSIVPATEQELNRAADSIDDGLGTVWAGDNREGWHGGAAFTRWVDTPQERKRAVELFASHCNQVRVMPFLEGIPCSIHGIVFDDTVVTLYPVEMVVMRSNRTFVYAATSTVWKPEASVVETLRGYARQMGEHLRTRVNYRGCFTFDGVWTKDGFVPTELNPRYGAGLFQFSRTAELPLYLWQLCWVEGVAPPIDPRELEVRLRHTVVSNRAIVAGMPLNRPPPEDSESGRVLHLRVEDPTGKPRYTVCEEAEAYATLRWGPSVVGGYLGYQIKPEALVPDAPAGPAVASLMRFADQHWKLDLGELRSFAPLAD